MRTGSATGPMTLFTIACTPPVTSVFHATLEIVMTTEPGVPLKSRFCFFGGGAAAGAAGAAPRHGGCAVTRTGSNNIAVADPTMTGGEAAAKPAVSDIHHSWAITGEATGAAGLATITGKRDPVRGMAGRAAEAERVGWG